MWYIGLLDMAILCIGILYIVNILSLCVVCVLSIYIIILLPPLVPDPYRGAFCF